MVVKMTYVVLSRSITLIGGLEEPIHRLCVVLGNTSAIVVEKADGELRSGMSLVGGTAGSLLSPEWAIFLVLDDS